MRITTIRVYQVDLPMTKTYKLSGGRVWTSLDTTIVALETDAGMTGWGEACPFGSSYLPAFAKGTRAVINELAPTILGRDPRQTDRINDAMDRALPGHPYGKTAIDMACWDILGKDAGMPVCDLMGGRAEGAVDLVSSVSAEGLEETLANLKALRQRGYRKHSVKFSGDVAEDIARLDVVAEILALGDDALCDCNGGWLQGDAVAVMQAARQRGLTLLFEQPCATYDQCLATSRMVSQPIMLDESLDDLTVLLRAIADNAFAAINIKIGKVGGLTKARLIRDVAAEAGLIVSLQDTGGSEIAAAAILHLAQSTPAALRHSLWDATELHDVSLADGKPDWVDGTMTAPETPGLGIHPKPDKLGEPVAVYWA